jgi:hypothetical protein
MSTPVPIQEQITALALALNLDPRLAHVYAQDLPECPDGADGWFAIPSVSVVAAKLSPEVTDPAEQYCRVVQLVMNKLGEARPLEGGYSNEVIVPARLRQHERTARSLETIAQGQPGEILILAAQTGGVCQGQSAAKFRRELGENAFGLGTVAIAALALTHPDNDTWFSQNHVLCLGDELDRNAQADYSHVPIFIFVKGRGIWYGGRPGCSPCANGGAATGFITS